MCDQTQEEQPFHHSIDLVMLTVNYLSKRKLRNTNQKTKKTSELLHVTRLLGLPLVAQEDAGELEMLFSHSSRRAGELEIFSKSRVGYSKYQMIDGDR